MRPNSAKTPDSYTEAQRHGRGVLFGKAVTPAVCRSRDGSGVFDRYHTVPLGQGQHFDRRGVVIRLTVERLTSYLVRTDRDEKAALRLYDWNIGVSGALLEDIGRLEVLFHNSVDRSLVDYSERKGRRTEWYEHDRLFTPEGRNDINNARKHARRAGKPERRGKVIAELSFGFWKYLCSQSYLTSLWVPALTGVFPQHPDAPDPRAVRPDVHDRMTRLHKLRNRIAHHEPIHNRDLGGDWQALVQIAGWICPDTTKWIVARTGVACCLARRWQLRPRHVTVCALPDDPPGHRPVT